MLHVKISDNAPFFSVAAVRICSHSSYLPNFIDIFTKSPAYFFDPPCIYSTAAKHNVINGTTIGVASYGALGHVLPPRLPTTFFLPHFGAIKLWRQSLMSNVFKLLCTTVIKISLFFILLREKKMKKVYKIFL